MRWHVKKSGERFWASAATEAVYDADEKRQVVESREAVQNALAFSKTWSKSAAAEEQANAWIFCVEDNGVDISEDRQEKLFDLFERGGAESIGVGLALARRIVRHHGGRIWVGSKPGEGSTFFFTLPKQQTPSSGEDDEGKSTE